MDATQILNFIAGHFWLAGILVTAIIALIVLELRNTSRLSVNPQQLVTQINQQQAVLWDIRSKKDFERGHITSAKHVHPDDLTVEMNHLHQKNPASRMEAAKNKPKHKKPEHKNKHQRKAGLRAQILAKIHTKPQQSDVTVILICANGMQSGHQVKKLGKMHNPVLYLHGGIAEWQQQKLPLVKT